MCKPNWADTLVALSSLISTILTLGLLIAAIWAGVTAIEAMRASRIASEAAKEANEQARRDSIEQTRPYVYAEILPSLAGTSQYDLRVSNVGRTAARSLRLEFDAWPEEIDDIAKQIKAFFETPRTLPPNASIRTYWRLTGNFTDGTKAAGMPEIGKIRVLYTSDEETKPQYKDEYDVLISKSGLWPVAEDGPEPTHVSGSDKEFYKMGQAIARSIGNLAR